jgi:hypothetical protein
LPYGCHVSPPLEALPHTTISQHAAQQVYVIKTRKKYLYNHLLTMKRHNALSTCHACVCRLQRLPVANFGRQKDSVTHHCTFDHHFCAAEPGGTVMGFCYPHQQKP